QVQVLLHAASTTMTPYPDYSTLHIPIMTLTLVFLYKEYHCAIDLQGSDAKLHDGTFISSCSPDFPRKRI
ncbi:MAG: hypothetical protein WDA72_10750, partial [Desulfomonilia bacterium]